MRSNRLVTLPILAFIVFFTLAGCGFPQATSEIPIEPKPTSIPPTETSIPPAPTSEPAIEATIAPNTPVPEIVHKDLPGSPFGKYYQTVHDQVNDRTAPQKQAFGGDDFRNGKYERPFNQSMDYLPLADLVMVQLNREDPLWVYVLIKVYQPLTSDPEANTHFMVELDTDLDSRGDFLIVSGTPKDSQWSTESVIVYSNPDLNVGGLTVVKPDERLSEGRGYFEEIFNDGKGKDADLAWSRLSKTDPNTVEIAFKNTLTGGEKGKFIWLPWSDAGMLDWSLFEHNDKFTFEQAGYPLKEDAANYPLKALWGIDNTCRVPSGFTPQGYMPGLCPNYDPEPSKGSSVPCTEVCYNFGNQTICVCAN